MTESRKTSRHLKFHDRWSHQLSRRFPAGEATQQTFVQRAFATMMNTHQDALCSSAGTEGDCLKNSSQRITHGSSRHRDVPHRTSAGDHNHQPRRSNAQDRPSLAHTCTLIAPFVDPVMRSYRDFTRSRPNATLDDRHQRFDPRCRRVLRSPHDLHRLR